ncbi:MAG: TRAM domain-containing protein [Clostridia bacterium]|nr:TRAM domain-containing protein [Clostridia bacterium]
MARKVARCVITLLGAAIATAIVDGINKLFTSSGYNGLGQIFLPWVVVLIYLASAVIVGTVFFFLSPAIIDSCVKLGNKIENKMSRMSLPDIAIALVGILIGLVIAYLLTGITRSIENAYAQTIINIALYLILAYTCCHILVKRRGEINVPSIFKRNRDKASKNSSAARNKILDTSAIIDGRIVDVAKTGIIEGELIVPSFVINELMHIADSADALKRNRGRRGLDLIKDMQSDSKINIKISETDYDDIEDVDMKILRLALETCSTVITNDYNLNKAAAVQKVSVLNINDVSNAVKPIMISGEELEVIISKEGKEAHQGVAYLEDGTMIVVEGGSGRVGEKVNVVVTSVLQTSAGRMIFAKTNE